MKNPAENNKRVAKNTLFLYFRMILIMLVTLYTSRGVLAELGIDDYGIYNVVGGVVLMFSFLNSCMSTATQRFLTFELGRGDTDKLKNVFAAALNIHIAIGILIIFLAETIGLWFVNEKLVIPDNRIAAANWVYQFSILTFCINIIQVPYNAVLIAHEKMNVYAYISIAGDIMKRAGLNCFGIKLCINKCLALPDGICSAVWHGSCVIKGPILSSIFFSVLQLMLLVGWHPRSQMPLWGLSLIFK